MKSIKTLCSTLFVLVLLDQSALKVMSSCVQIALRCTSLEEALINDGAGEKTSLTCTDEPSALIVDSPLLEVSSEIMFNGAKLSDEAVEIINRLSIHAANMRFMPRRIKKALPNLMVIAINKSGLTRLDRDDMRQFGSTLIHASFWGNLLQSIEADV